MKGGALHIESLNLGVRIFSFDGITNSDIMW